MCLHCGPGLLGLHAAAPPNSKKAMAACYSKIKYTKALFTQGEVLILLTFFEVKVIFCNNFNCCFHPVNVPVVRGFPVVWIKVHFLLVFSHRKISF